MDGVATRPRILFVEDEASISEPFCEALRREGFDPVVAPTAAAAMAAAERTEPDLVLLDLRLPDGDGRDVCRRLRRLSDTPIIMLTASGTETDRVVGLELGADDYVVKPFSSREVISRIRAVLRRTAGPRVSGPSAIRVDGIDLDIAARRVELDGRELQLPRKEFDLLAELMRHAGEVVSREDLMSRVWDVNWFGSTKTLDVHIASLRRKLGDDPAAPRFIETRARRRLSLRRARGGRPVSLRARLVLGVAYVLLLALVALGIPLSLSLRDRVNAEVRGQATSQADVVASSAGEFLAKSRQHGLNHLVELSARSVRGRVMVLNRQGVVVADSAGAAAVGSSYASREEVSGALAGSSVQLTRASKTLGTDLLATAAPVLHGGRTIGAVRVTQSVAAVDHAVRTAIVGLALLGGVVLLLGLVAGVLIAGQLARPIRRLDLAARQVTEGALDTRVPVEGSSEQRSLAQTFNAMTERIDRLLAAQREFVADASHQLRTPLTGLRLQLEELRETTRAEDPRATRLDAGLHEVDRLSQIVDELLILSRAGEHELPGEAVSLEDACTRAAERWRGTAAGAGQAIACELDGAGDAWCAPADLDRALDSLIENAIRYSPRGAEITISATPGTISVGDRGPGLEPGEEEAVFERFYRGSSGRVDSAGTGLGLAIARELMEQWGGSVTLGNRENGGALATVALPNRPVGAGAAR